MNTLPILPETAPFNAEQRLWLNGFLAGYFARAVVPPTGAIAEHSAPSKPAKPLPILFGSQTGTAEGIAKRLAKTAEKHGFASRVLPLNDHPEANLAKASLAVIVSSTWGDGEPPDNAVNFWNWLNAANAPRLDHLQFALLGLGDRNYSDFCGASRKFEARLLELGAKPLIPRGECDVDYEAAANAWIETLWQKLDADPAAAAPATALASSSVSQIPAASGNGEAAAAASVFGKTNPFPAKLLKNRCLNRPGSSKEVRHYEISLDGSGMNYEAGDALGVMPMNCPELVEEIIGALRAKPGDLVSIGEDHLELREALLRRLDITKPSQEFFAAIANAAPACELGALLDLEKREDMRKWLHGRGVIDLLLLLEEPMPVADFVKRLKRLTPRLYSIASSPKAHPGEVHLTVSAVRYESHGRGRKGVASTFLADRVGDAGMVKVFVQPSHGFRPPANPSAPMIMVGPGTGIAPFRAFLEERQATGAKGWNWLFFGDQKRETDFLYEEELTAWRNDGHLRRLDLAFSRDQANKVYVQDRMREYSGELWNWLENGAHFYVCGDASRMARDVDAALHRVVEEVGGRTAEDAKTYVAKMKSEKRYQRDVY